jgi:hypothetical protein
MAKSVGFGQVDEENMAELLDSHRRNSWMRSWAW